MLNIPRRLKGYLYASIIFISAVFGTFIVITIADYLILESMRMPPVLITQKEGI